MKRQDLEKLRSKSITELRKQLQEEQTKLVNLRMQLAVGKLKNVRAVKLQRKNIAQILTILREKELNLTTDK